MRKYGTCKKSGNALKFILGFQWRFCVYRFQTEWMENESTPVTKWCSMTINEVEKIFLELDVKKVLDKEFDNRRTRIDKLQVAQLRDECRRRGLEPTGRKVGANINLIF